MGKTMQGQTALITGASRGLGRHLCKSFAAAGDNVAAVARSEADLSTLREEIDTTWWDRSEYKYDKKLLIKPADIAKLIETVLTLPENVLFQKAVFFPTCEVEIW